MTEITDLSGVHCFLVEGRDKALLIDTMTGLRGLPAFVATLTDLPVEVALTHGHMDHAGGVFEFGRCYIHPADIPMLDGRRVPCGIDARKVLETGILPMMHGGILSREGGQIGVGYARTPLECFRHALN